MEVFHDVHKVSYSLLQRCICSKSSSPLLANQSDLATTSTSAAFLQFLQYRLQTQIEDLVIEVLLNLGY